MVTDFGSTVVGPASRVAQALMIVDTEIVDAVVLDVSLDEELSYPVADVLLARGIPFLFSTGYDRDRLKDGYRALPMLQKPFHPRELGKALTSLFHRAPGRIAAA